MVFKTKNSTITLESTQMTYSRVIHARVYTIRVEYTKEETVSEVLAKMERITKVDDDMLIDFALMQRTINTTLDNNLD